MKELFSSSGTVYTDRPFYFCYGWPNLHVWPVSTCTTMLLRGTVVPVLGHTCCFGYFYMHPTFTSLGDILPTLSSIGAARTPRPINRHRNSDNLLDVLFVTLLVPFMGDHNCSALALARGHTMESKLCSSTHSLHMVVSPPSTKARCAGVNGGSEAFLAHFIGSLV